MKNVLLILICTIFGLVSCRLYDDRCDYKVVIGYKIGDNAVTDTIIIEDELEGTVLAYVIGNDGLQIIATYGKRAWYPTIIYNGSNPVTVEHFDYTIIRNFKVNGFTGKEVSYDN